MEAEACGHVLMHPQQRLKATMLAIDSITLDDVNDIAKELCEHLSHIDPVKGIRPSAIVACSPLVDRDQVPFAVNEEQVTNVILEALTEQLEPPEETDVPITLITEEEIEAKVRAYPPELVPLEGKAAKEPSNNVGVVQKRLSNGIKLNLKSLNTEPQRANFRLYIPGMTMNDHDIAIS